MLQHTIPIRRDGSRRLLIPIALTCAAGLFLLSACSDLLEVDDPDIVTPDRLEGEAGLATLRNGALSQFTLAWTGGGRQTDNFVLESGLLADEWIASGTFPTREEIDKREIDLANGTLEGMFLALHQARADLERAAIQIERGVENPSADDRIPEMRAYAGYMYVGFGENYCSGVPFSETIDSILYGDPLTTAQMFEAAIDHFDAVLNHPAASETMEHLAMVGKGRALLNLNRAQDAAAAVTDVPDEFVAYIWHSNTAGRTRNGVFDMNVSQGRWSLAELEGTNGLPFRSSGDPRVPAVFVGPGFDGVTDLYSPGLYLSQVDRFPLASGVEARLIEAEADLQDAGTAWLTTLNDLRGDFGSLAAILYPDNPGYGGTLAPLADPGNQAARENLLFRERAFWLFATAHRLGDLRRLIRQYGRDIEAVFPTGQYFKQGTYGADVNFPVPTQERNNPQFVDIAQGECLDRNP